MSYVDHRVPNANLLGGSEGLGNGLRYALSALELGRITSRHAPSGSAKRLSTRR